MARISVANRSRTKTPGRVGRGEVYNSKEKVCDLLRSPNDGPVRTKIGWRE